jgi:hypothetical protein
LIVYGRFSPWTPQGQLLLYRRLVQLRHAGEIASYPWSPDDAWLTLRSAPPLPMFW